jgi:hypothetical protein
MDIIDKNAIKRKLEQMRCPKCNEKPSVLITTNGFEFKCCCDSFKQKLVKEAENEIAKQAKTNIENELKNIFKKF